jgi:hypothetical protein
MFPGKSSAALEPVLDPEVVDGFFQLLNTGRVVCPFSGEDITHLVHEGMREIEQEQIDEAFQIQKAIRAKHPGIRPTREAGMRTALTLHPVIANRIMKDEGREALQDDGFIKDIAKFHPEFALPEVKGPATITPGVTFAPDGTVQP